ncbi:hypothetical protein ACCC88_11800 [Sphingomonas sp. Sphisp140]|uniref:hypothetical protein n=1 Tax=unclassified Sphingomonas TaxID=196159 RepID=UPI0039B11444
MLLSRAALLALLPLVAPAALHAQAVPTEQPSAAASALARELGPMGWGNPASSVDEVAAGLTRRILQTQLSWRGANCDPADPRCRGAAERLAREAAPGMMAAYRDMRVRLLAYMIDDQLGPDEIAAAQAAVGTPGGLALARLFATVSDPRKLSPAYARRAQAALAEGGLPNEKDLVERLYDVTKDLPRVRLVTPPPPPTPTRKTP